MFKQKKSCFLNKVNGLTIKVNYTQYNWNFNVLYMLNKLNNTKKYEVNLKETATKVTNHNISKGCFLRKG